jgi:hypothetical protein
MFNRAVGRERIRHADGFDKFKPCPNERVLRTIKPGAGNTFKKQFIFEYFAHKNGNIFIVRIYI